MSDLRPLLQLRAAGLRGRSRLAARFGGATIAAITLLVAGLPAYLPAGIGRRTDVLTLLPSALVGVLVVALVTAAASGGGRELLPREQAVAFPVSTATDHLGALVLAPLNIAWLIQAWILLGATAFVVGPRPGLVLSQLLVIVWLVTATAVAQVAAWGVEWLRRGARGVWAVRATGLSVGLLGAFLVAGGHLVGVLQASPTVLVTIASVQVGGGVTWLWVHMLFSLLAVAAAAVALGAWVARAVVRRPPREEARLETAVFGARPHPGSDLAALMRTDRSGIWRSVPLRRGLAVLAVTPGLVAVAGDLEWAMLTVLPGLVASGGALLFGVNSWCLDGRGALWRDSLPVSPRVAFGSRVAVLAEVLLVATSATLALASVRAGLPSTAEVAALACVTLVVVLQVVSASLRWSVGRPFAVDMRSARATPAPPMTMVGYSARLALTTTLTGMVFAVTAHVSWEWSVLVALPFALVSALRLVRTADAWADPVTRCRVVGTVAS